jgi:oxygen-independent coproporphyrinogen-3 oxidase
MEDWQAGGFGIYVHWPFCQSKCPYCDFNSHVVSSIDQGRWKDAFCREIDMLAAEIGPRVVQTIFFGGGTPSLMQPDVVAAVIDRIALHWTVSNDMEITLEANPSSVEAGRFADFAAAGINRVSMGIQALNDRDLTALGRRHTAAEAVVAFEIARKQFKRVSFDLIYARQQQTLVEWEAELTTALSMAIDHLSLYQLTIEEGTAFHDRFSRGGLRGLPDEDLSAEMYDLTQDICLAHGMPAYEVSNHARPGSESRHNLIYWRMGDYGAIGPGAHGRLTCSGQRRATENLRSPSAWLQQVEATGSGRVVDDVLSGPEQANEVLLMSLRLNEGMDLDRVEKLRGSPLDRQKLARLESHGMIARTGRQVTTTKAGRLLLNAIIRELT